MARSSANSNVQFDWTSLGKTFNNVAGGVDAVVKGDYGAMTNQFGKSAASITAGTGNEELAG